MNGDEAAAAIRDGRKVEAVYMPGIPGVNGERAVHARGHVIAYSETPQVLIETDDGRFIWWRASLTRETKETQ